MDVIILAIPVDVALDKASYLLDQINDNALLIDVGSIIDSDMIDIIIMYYSFFFNK